MRIIYIDVDSLRPDHMGCYGYTRNTTPNIDRLAAQGAKFTRAYCAASPCVPSRASFISSRYAINHGAISHRDPAASFYYNPDGDWHSERYPYFTRYLRQAGYKTVTFSSFGDRHNAHWFFSGWSEVHSHTLKCGNEDAHEVNEHVIPWIKRHGREDNYFLHVQYWDPHGFYTCPEEYFEQFADQPLGAFPDEETIREHRKMAHPRSATFLHWTKDQSIPSKMPREIANRADLARLVNGYDGGISYMDRFVGEIMETFRELGIEDEIGIIISADHGESFGEQGIYMEHGMAAESVHHLPLIMRLPGVTKPGTVIDDLIYNVDVVATITELVGRELPSGWDGRSFMGAITGAGWERHDYLVLEHALYACQRAVFDGRWYFIRTYHEGFYDFPSVVLYDLWHDPNQTASVAGEYPEIVGLMEHRLNEWLQHNATKHGNIADPMQQIIVDGPYHYLKPEQWARRLREMGWDVQAEAIEQGKR